MGILPLNHVQEAWRLHACAAHGHSWRPLEDKVVTGRRAAGSLAFPANFMFVAAMNPCGHGDHCAEESKYIWDTWCAPPSHQSEFRGFSAPRSS